MRGITIEYALLEKFRQRGRVIDDAIHGTSVR